MQAWATTVVVVGTASLALGQLPPRYAIDEITPLPSGDSSTGVALSEIGTVLGTSLIGEGATPGAPFLLTQAGVQTPFSGLAPNALANDELVSGAIWVFDHFEAVIRKPDGSLVQLPPPPGLGFRESAANGVNNVGQAVGWSTGGPNGDIGFVWEESSGQQLLTGPNGELSFAFDINDAGVIVGWSNQTSNAALWDDGLILPITSIGPFGSSPSSINELNHVAGRYRTAANEQHAFFWDGTTMVDLGTLGGDWSFAYDLNDSGHVAGEAQDGAGIWRAAVWIDNQIHDLNHRIPPGTTWDLLEARGINNTGEIVGTGRLGGQLRAFLLTPTCAADFTGDRELDFFDLLTFLFAFDAGSPSADLVTPFGTPDFFDILAFLDAFDAGC